MRNTSATVVDTTDGIAKVDISVPDKPIKKEFFIQIEGRWISEDMANDWKKTWTKPGPRSKK